MLVNKRLDFEQTLLLQSWLLNCQTDVQGLCTEILILMNFIELTIKSPTCHFDTDLVHSSI